MAVIRVHDHLLPPTSLNSLTKFQTQPFLHHCKTPGKLQISCCNSKRIDDMQLAMELTTEIEKMNTQRVQTQEAMKTSRKLLYAEVGLFLGLEGEELKRKWEGMKDDEKWNLAEEFVLDWGSNFHPLSARSVKELVDQHLFHDDDDNNKDNNDSSSSSTLLDGLRKFIGF